MSLNLQDLFETLALQAGAAIMEIKAKGLDISHKADASPVTLADQAAEKLILDGLRAAGVSVPIIAEEAVSAGQVPSLDGREFILVDPLDGTKEFINDRSDFTVNIALIRDGAPVMGVVFAPARGQLYLGGPQGAYRKQDGNSQAIRIQPRQAETPARIVASKSHSTQETDAFIAHYPHAERVGVGSSLKFCLLAAGEADLYPRFGRTMEWDTAAGDAVLRAAGGMTVFTDHSDFRYGKINQSHDSDFANPHFVAAGDRTWL